MSQLLSKYEILFSSVYTNPTVQKAFRKHLETEYNDDSYECVLTIESLGGNLDEGDFKKQLESLVTKHIKTGASMEINVSAKERSRIQENIESYLNNEMDREHVISCLNEIRGVINKQLKTDPFPRFIRSKAFLSIAASLTGVPEVMSLRIASVFRYESLDFQIPFITKKDVDLSNYLRKDFYDWRLIYTGNNTNGYASELDLFPDIPFMKNCSLCKVDTILPYSFDVCCVINSRYKHMTDTFSQIERIDVVNYLKSSDVKEQYKDIETSGTDSAVICTYTHFPFPLNMRRVFQSTSIVKGEDVISIISKPLEGADETTRFLDKSKVELESNGVKKKIGMYEMPCFSCNHYTRLDSNRTLHTSILMLNLGGWVSNGKSKILKEYSLKSAVEKLVSDGSKMYDLHMGKLIKEDFNIDNYKDYMSQCTQGRLMSNARFHFDEKL